VLGAFLAPAGAEAPVDTLGMPHYHARRYQRGHSARKVSKGGNLIKVEKKGYPMNWGYLSASE